MKEESSLIEIFRIQHIWTYLYHQKHLPACLSFLWVNLCMNLHVFYVYAYAVLPKLYQISFFIKNSNKSTLYSIIHDTIFDLRKFKLKNHLNVLNICVRSRPFIQKVKRLSMYWLKLNTENVLEVDQIMIHWTWFLQTQIYN